MAKSFSVGEPVDIGDGRSPSPVTVGEKPNEKYSDFVAKSRFFFCTNYDDCLDFAAINGWNGFSCIGCNLSEEIKEGERPRGEKLVEDAESCSWVISTLITRFGLGRDRTEQKGAVRLRCKN